ncbi:psbP domain-containing protein 3, chloroplastic isoform X1 [Macadamia integrifolia]|uniref:psbP domain-containing protein 3, chloroplastic isoform X1 n=1 Tax=Macadamia integrifolia TaxID=60698 RepID=UPI001C4EE057|nr:psbP domain-containing protein 3, chloroplastic isoform X1 [Macadamia integrifolia]
MASVPSLFSNSSRYRIGDSTLLRRNRKGICICRNELVLCSRKSETEQKSSLRLHGQGTKRRQALLQIIFGAFSFPSIAVANASADTDLQEDFRIYSDDTNKFKISIPQDWQVGAGKADGIRSVTAFYPGEASSSNVSVLITGLGADFTRLESFGKVDAFAENLVSGLDRSWQRPPGLAAKLIDSKTTNGLYYIEYSLQNPGESCRHIISVIGMASNGWYNRLYTVTGQYVEEESEKYRSKIEKSVLSFRFI